MSGMVLMEPSRPVQSTPDQPDSIESGFDFSSGVATCRAACARPTVQLRCRCHQAKLRPRSAMQSCANSKQL